MVRFFERPRVIGFLALAIVSWTSSCADDPDTEAPPAPVVYPVVTPTSLTTQMLVGSAEPGATIEVTGAAAVVITVADSFTAGWRVEVTLKPDQANTLAVTATDGAGNVSLPTTVAIAHQAPHPDTLAVSIDRPIFSTDDAALTARATVTSLEAGVPLAGLEVRFSLGEFGGAADQVVQADAHGNAVATFEGLTVPGDGLLTATSVDDETLVAVAPFTVSPGDPAIFELTLSTDGGSGEGSSPAMATAGSDVGIAVKVTDASGNPIDAPVVLTTTAPGAISSSKLRGVTKTGTYTVTASLLGTGLSVSKDLVVTPGADATVALTASPDVVVAGKPVAIEAKVLDAYGNDTGHAATVAATPSSVVLDGLSPACAGAQDPSKTPFTPCVSSEHALAELGQAITVTASYTGVTSATVTLTVLPAPAQTIAQFEAEAAGAAADGRIFAGEDVTYAYRVEDGYGNRVEVPLAVTVTDPDAKILDDGVSGQGLIAGLVRASIVPYQVNARISGAGVTKSFAVIVDPALGDRFVTLIPSTSSIAMGSEVILTAAARDLYGNPIPGAAFGFAVDPSNCAPLPVAECFSPSTTQSGQSATFTISRVGVFALTASYTDAGGTFTDTRYVAVQPVLDVTPPTITVKNVRKNGTLCAIPGSCMWQTGDTVSFEVDVVDDHGISQVSYSAFFATAGTSGTLRNRIILIPSGTLSASPSFTFTIPNSTALEDVDLVGQALDQVGNIANSAAWTIRVRAIDPTIADGKDRTVSLLGAVTGGADIDDVVYDASGRLLAIDNNNDRIVQIVSATSYFTFANLNTTPNYVAADDAGNIFVSGSSNNGGGNNSSVIERVSSTGTMSTYINVSGDIDTSVGSGGACEGGSGNGGEAMGLTVVPVLRGSIHLSPTTPQSGPHIVVADASGSPTATYTFGGGADVCAARDALRTAMQNTPFAGVTPLRGPCTTFGTDYGDLELLANWSIVPGATDVTNATGNANISTDSPIDLQSTLIFGGRSRYVHAMDATDSGQAPSCYRVRYDFGSGENRAVAATYEGSPLELVLYGADRTSGALRRVVASTGATTTIANLQTPHDLVVAPSGCLIATEENAGRVVMVDPNSVSCAQLPCDTQILATGFSTVRGLAIDSVDVVAAWTPWQPNEVSLTARIPGSAGNTLPLTSSTAAFTAVGFSGGTDAANGAKAVGTISVGAAVTDGVTVTVGTHVYELDLAGSPAVAAGHVPVHVVTTAQAEVASKLASAIRQTEARLLITDNTADAVVEIRPTLYDTTDCF